MKTQSCVNCDKVINDGVKFCPNCGVLLDKGRKFSRRLRAIFRVLDS